MVVVNHLKNIQRIIDVIKSDGTVFDGGITPGLLIDVIFGNPNNDEKLAINEKPVVYVTTRNNIQITRYPFGSGIPNSQNQISVEYEIVLLAESFEDTEFSQKQLYSLMASLENIFSNNPTFTDPEDIGNDPIFTRSIINQVPWDDTSRGKLVTSITYVLSATIGNEFSVDFPGIGNVILLSKPNNPEGVIFSEDRLYDDPNRVITPNGDFGSLYIEYQSNPTLDNAFRIKFGTQEEITINSGESSRIVKVVYIEINPTAQFDEIERTILHMEIVKI